MADPDFRALCAELIELDQAEPGEYADWGQRWAAAIKRADAALAQPEPQGPTDEELWSMYQEEARDFSPTAYARAILQRWGRPAIEPVPVGERLPVPQQGE